jgi:Family of unknown function (DUF5678)
MSEREQERLELDPYDGEWVAVRHNRVVAHAPDEAALRANPDVADDDDVYPVGDPITGFYVLSA